MLGFKVFWSDWSWRPEGDGRDLVGKGGIWLVVAWRGVVGIGRVSVLPVILLERVMAEESGIVTSPPQGGGIGSQGAGGSGASSSPPVAAPSAPASFGDRLKAALPAGEPVVPTPAAPAGTPVAAVPGQPVPVVETAKEPTVAELRAELEALKSSMGTEEERALTKQLAQWGYQEQMRLRAQAAAPAAAASTAVADPHAPHSITGVVPFSESDRSWLTTDSTGNVVAQAGAPSDVLPRFHAHQRSQAEFFRSFAQDPGKYLSPLIQAEAKKIAAEEYQALSGKQSAQASVQQIIEQNRNWIYEQDPGTGQARVDTFGRPKLTEAGSLYAGFTERLQSQGVQDPQAQHEIAQQMVIGHYAAKQLQTRQAAGAGQGAQPAVPGQAVQAVQAGQPQKTAAELDAEAKAALLVRAGQMAAAAPLTGVVPSGAGQANGVKPLTFKERMLVNFAKAGVNMNS